LQQVGFGDGMYVCHCGIKGKSNILNATHPAHQITRSIEEEPHREWGCFLLPESMADLKWTGEMGTGELLYFVQTKQLSVQSGLTFCNHSAYSLKV
jgi:hypothetical protein